MRKSLMLILLFVCWHLNALNIHHSSYWVEINYGRGSIENQTIEDLGIKLTYIPKQTLYSVHYLRADGLMDFDNEYPDKYSDIRVIGAQYGYCLNHGMLKACASAGLSYTKMREGIPPLEFVLFGYVYSSYKTLETIGVPISCDVDFILSRFIGLKAGIYINPNSKHSFWTANAGIILGKLR